MKKILCTGLVLLLAVLLLPWPAVLAGSDFQTSKIPDTTPETDAYEAPNQDSPLAYLVYGTVAVGFVMAIVLAAVVLINKKKEQ